MHPAFRLTFLPPNLITLSRPVVVAWICYSLIQEPAATSDSLWMLAAFLFFYWVSDYVDGYVARLLGMTSNYGAKLDLFCDRVCDFLVVFTILIVHDLTYWIPVLFYMLGRLAPEFLYFLHAARFKDSPLFVSWSEKAYKIYGEVFYFIRTMFFAFVLFGDPHWIVSAVFVLSNAVFLVDGLIILAGFAKQNKSGNAEVDGNRSS
ncbi:MAG: CDP-alcohol phosphatidyltransferase family protein [Rhodospirillales bacterium]